MRIAVMKERRAGEKRVAISPDTCRRLVGHGCQVVIESHAGASAGMGDALYEAAGGQIASDAKTAVADADIVVRTCPPMPAGQAGSADSETANLDGTEILDEIAILPKKAILIGPLDPYASDGLVDRLVAHGLAGAFAMELIPRIGRAQTMDVLSSQANLAGYCAVIYAANLSGRVLPMMMTAAGTIRPAKYFILGAGVAGLQAIATARRLGAVVSATDIRPAAREQIESLGARFVGLSELSGATETSGGYAGELGEDDHRQQAELVALAIADSDVVITTALTQGRKAPMLVTTELVETMREGAVIVDLAGAQGGNCALTQSGETRTHAGVAIVDGSNLVNYVAGDASLLLARNIASFVETILDKATGQLNIDWSDEIVAACALVRDGKPARESTAAMEAN